VERDLSDSWTNVFTLSIVCGKTPVRVTAGVPTLRWPNAGVDSLDIIDDVRENSLGAPLDEDAEEVC
jgi:hypothetical protein